MTLAMARAAALKEVQKLKLQLTANTSLTLGELAREWLESKDLRPGSKFTIRS